MVDQITKNDALALLAHQDIDEIISVDSTESVALNSFRTVKMSAGTSSMPVLSALPTAGWVTDSGEATDSKPLSKVSWDQKKLVAEEIAVIIPVHENILSDSRFDLWGEIKPLVNAEFGRVLDSAVFFGKGKPASWTDPALVPGAIAAGNTVTEGAGVDLADDINEAFSLVEADGFDVNSAYTGRFLRSELRGLRDANNQPIYIDGVRSDGNTSAIYGQPLSYVLNRSWDPSQAIMLVGDASKVVLGIREDVQIKILDQATFGSGESQINLAERDMVALRFKFRVAYATAFSTAGSAEADTVFPFAAITPQGEDDEEPTEPVTDDEA